MQRPLFEAVAFCKMSFREVSVCVPSYSPSGRPKSVLSPLTLCPGAVSDILAHYDGRGESSWIIPRGAGVINTHESRHLSGSAKRNFGTYNNIIVRTHAMQVHTILSTVMQTRGVQATIGCTMEAANRKIPTAPVASRHQLFCRGD